MHLQCHIAYDAISLARRGARVTGVDFSRAALAAAAALADALRACRWSWSRPTRRSSRRRLHGRFDLVYATIGVLGWIEDIDAWMRSVFAALRPGGRLVLVETAPAVSDGRRRSTRCVLDFPYAFDGPREFDEAGLLRRPRRGGRGDQDDRVRALARARS